MTTTTKKKPVTAADATIDDLLLWAARSTGWNGRDYPPIKRRLTGGCVLTVIVPRLWQGRVPRRLHDWRLAPVVDLAVQRRRRRAEQVVHEEQRRA